MSEKEFDFTKKKRVVVKIGSSSLNRGETGNLNFTKLEHLVREICDMRNRGMDVCLVSSGKTHDDIPENVCRVQPDRRTDPDDKKYNGKPSVERKRPEYI